MERNRRKRIFVWTLILAMLLQNIVYAGEWKQENSDWYYEQEGVRQVGWIHDGSGWYYMDQDGKLRSGWFQEGETWYFLNTVHDGFYGRALTDQWAWVDGYCYLFDSDGKMYANCTTPDGYEVNADGRWTVDGVVQFVDGKGIITKETASTNTFSGGSGGGSSSSGGSGGSSTGESGSNQGEGNINDGSGENTSGGSDTDDGGFVSEDFPGVVFTEAVEIENVDFTVESDSNTVVVSDSEAVQNWKVGEVYVLHDEEFPENDIAVKITGIVQSDGGVEVSYEMPELSEVVDSMEVQGTESTYGEFIPAEGVTMTPVESGMSRMRMARAAVPMVDTQGTLELFKKYHLEREWEGITISGEFMIESIDYHFVMEDDNIEIVSLSVNNSFDGSVQYGDAMGKNTEIKLGSLSCFTPSGFWIRGDVYFRFDSEGKLTIGFYLDNETGIQYTDTQGFEPIFQLQGDITNVNLVGSMKARLALEPVVTYLGIKLITVGIEGGYGFDGSAEIFGNDPLEFCVDGDVYNVCKIYAELSLAELTFYEYEKDFDGNVMNQKIHVEETGVVPECTCGSYQGMVKNSQNSAPVNEAKVEIFQNGNSKGAVYTGEDGTFEGRSLRAGSYLLRVQASGFQVYEETIEITSKEKTELEILLTPGDPVITIPDSNWSGYVKEIETLSPVADATLQIWKDGKELMSVVTDEDGYYEGDYLEPGSYFLRVLADGYEVYEKLLEIKEGIETVIDISLTLKDEQGMYSNWTGYVIDYRTQEPIEQATVEFLQGDKVVVAVDTNTEGFCEGTSLAPGEYIIRVSAEGYADLILTVKISDRKAKEYHWSLNEKDDLIGSRYGHIVTVPQPVEPFPRRYVPGAKVELIQNGIVVYTFYSDENGNYEIDGLPIGDYTARVSAPGFYETESEFDIGIGPGQVDIPLDILQVKPSVTVYDKVNGHQLTELVDIQTLAYCLDGIYREDAPFSFDGSYPVYLGQYRITVIPLVAEYKGAEMVVELTEDGDNHFDIYIDPVPTVSTAVQQKLAAVMNQESLMTEEEQEKDISQDTNTISNDIQLDIQPEIDKEAEDLKDTSSEEKGTAESSDQEAEPPIDVETNVLDVNQKQETDPDEQIPVKAPEDDEKESDLESEEEMPANKDDAAVEQAADLEMDSAENPVSKEPESEDKLFQELDQESDKEVVEQENLKEDEPVIEKETSEDNELDFQLSD